MIENIILAQLLVGFEKNLDKIIIKNTKNSLGFLKVLRKEGLITGFVSNGTSFTVHLKYINNLPAIYQIKTFSKASKLFYIKSKDIIAMVKKNKNIIHILKTNKGFLTNHTILKQKIGGILVAQIK